MFGLEFSKWHWEAEFEAPLIQSIAPSKVSDDDNTGAQFRVHIGLNAYSTKYLQQAESATPPSYYQMA